MGLVGVDFNAAERLLHITEEQVADACSMISRIARDPDDELLILEMLGLVTED